MNRLLPILLAFAATLAIGLFAGCKKDPPPATPSTDPAAPDGGTSTPTAPDTPGTGSATATTGGVIDDLVIQPVALADNTAATDMAAIAADHFADEKYVVEGNDGWLFLTKELRFLGHPNFTGADAANTSRATKKEWADPIPAILNFNDQLKAKGIHLVLAPVPAKAAIYPDKLMGSDPAKRHDLALHSCYENLREEGVDVLDLTDAFLAARAKAPMHCTTDTHWSPAAIELTADLIKAHTDALPDLAGLAGDTTYTFRALENDHIGDLADMLDRDTTETLTARRVTADGRKPIADDDASPILLLGDSHVQFCDSSDFGFIGAGLGDHLAHRFGRPVATISNRGSGTTVVRSALLEKPAGFLDGKKLLVWVFAARDFTESTNGWRKLPIEQE